MSDNAHARLSPSSAHRWMRCIASLRLEERLPNTTSSYAEEGTGAHELAQWTLNDNAHRCEAYLGRITENGTEVTREMCEFVQEYVDRVLEYAEGNQLFVEQRVTINEPGHAVEPTGEFIFGTSDAIIITADGELQVHDLKYGMGVKVHAEKNEQLAMYAVAALEEYGLVEDINRVRVVIHQPRISWLDEWDFTLEELANFRTNAIAAGTKAIELSELPDDADISDENFAPGDKQCGFCRARAICPALAERVAVEIGGASNEMTFDDLEAVVDDITTPQYIADDGTEDLARKMSMVDLIESWCRAVRAEVERRLFAGIDIPGYKLVEGKRGTRQWRLEAEAEQLLRSMRLRQEEMYSFKLISPAQAEKLLKKENPRRWKKCEELIIQREGQPSVAPASDKRPALTIKSVTEEIENLDDEALA